MNDRYVSGATLTIHQGGLALVVLAPMLFATWALFKAVSGSFVPAERHGFLFAAARHSIGADIILNGGMIAATSLALIFVPLFYYLVITVKALFFGAGTCSVATTGAVDTASNSRSLLTAQSMAEPLSL